MQFADAVKAYGVRGLASKLGVTPAYVSLIARGKRPLTPEVLTKLDGLVNKTATKERRKRSSESHEEWLRDQDSNLGRLIQSQVSYH